MPYADVATAVDGEKEVKEKAYFGDDGRLKTEDHVEGMVARPTNATGHVELFARKLTTILLVLHDEPVRAGQTTKTTSTLRDASDTRQLTYEDVQAITATLRMYQQKVSEEKMAVVLHNYEAKVIALVKGVAAYTIGAALLHAWECGIEAMLSMVVAQSEVEAQRNSGAGGKAASAEKGGAKRERTLEKAENEIEGLKKQIANL